MNSGNKDMKDVRSEGEGFTALARRFLQGFVMGGGAILPGVSGGVLCAAFGLYIPLMRLLSHPKRELKSSYRTWLFVGLGWLCGFACFAVAVMLMLDFSGGIAESLFAGLIVGTFPALYREAQNDPHSSGGNDICKKRKALRYTILAVSFTVMLALLITVNDSGTKSVLLEAPVLIRFTACGVILGLGMIIPGVTSSSFLMMLGLYEPMTDGIAAFDLSVILPTFLGVAISFVVTARLINALFDKFYTEAYFAVMGIVAASVIMIIPTSFDTVWSFILCAVLFLGGAAASIMAEKELGG